MEKVYRLYGDIGNNNSNSLLDAIINNDCKYIISYYEKEGSLDYCDDYGDNLLHKAARFKHFEIVDLIIKLGVDINKKNKRGNTPLHIATQFKSEDIIHKIIEEGGDINSTNFKGETPLIIASSLGYDNIVNVLLNNGAKINISDENGMFPIHYGAKSGKISIIRSLINWGASLTDVDDRCNNVLHHASLYNNYELISYILRNITLNNNINIFGETALHIASLNSGPDCVLLLLRYGFNPNIKNNDGKKPIDLAIDAGRSDIVDLFNDYINSKEYREHYLNFHLHNAVINDNYQYIFEKTNYKTVNDFDYFGKSLLYYAIVLKNMKMVELLYRKGARITNLDDCNQSAVILAIYNNDNDMVRFFLSKGSNPNEVNNNRCLLYYSILKSNYEMTKLLIKYHADTNYIDNRHRTIYSYAVEFANDDIIELLVNKQ